MMNETIFFSPLKNLHYSYLLSLNSATKTKTTSKLRKMSSIANIRKLKSTKKKTISISLLAAQKNDGKLVCSESSEFSA